MTRFDSVLVANRGEIARRIFRSGRDMGLRTVAVYVDADADAPFAEEADQAVRVEGYLDGEAVIAAALATGAGAIHPGYGFLAENAPFAAAVIEAGLAWVGPSAEAITTMGDKIEAKSLAASTGVPVLASSNDADDFGTVGFPLLIKAAAGGGGKGMRVVEVRDDLPDAVAAARRESAAAFGDDRVFAERYVPRARHVEIQILGDAHGALVHLGERECSIQRRHQKVIEESPAPRLDGEVRQSMAEAALRLGAALDYRSAGTVEFLVDDDSGDYFFLEVNTRLQVEHPVTEEVTGIDLVREQLRIAMGEALGYDQDAIRTRGHAIEARLYAEDPANDYLPDTGTLDAFSAAAEPSVRWDTGVRQGSVIGVDFDPMIAKVVASGPTRVEAAGRLALALERLHIGGPRTNRDLLVGVLRSTEFLTGDTTTDFLDRVAPPGRRPIDDAELRLGATAAALWLHADHRAAADVLPSVPGAWRLGRLPAERVELGHEDRSVTVHYRRARDGSFTLGPAGDEGRAVIRTWSPTHIDLEVDGRRRRLTTTRAERHLHLTGAGGTITFALTPRFHPPEVELPGGAITAPMPGKVIEVRVAVGDGVVVGQVVAVLEAMKMENHLRATEAGIVTEVSMAVGDQVEKDVLLLSIDTGDGEADGSPDSGGGGA